MKCLLLLVKPRLSINMIGSGLSRDIPVHVAQATNLLVNTLLHGASKEPFPWRFVWLVKYLFTAHGYLHIWSSLLPVITSRISSQYTHFIAPARIPVYVYSVAHESNVYCYYILWVVSLLWKCCSTTGLLFSISSRRDIFNVGIARFSYSCPRMLDYDV